MIITGPPRSNANHTRAALAFVLAIVAHVVAVLFLLLWSRISPDALVAKGPPPKQVQLRPLTAQQFEQNRGRAGPKTEAPQTPKADQKKPETPPKGQVVAVPQGNNALPDNAKYLAESNNKVDKETRAKQQTAFYKNAASQQTAPKARQGEGVDDVAAAQTQGNNGRGFDDRPARQQNEQAAIEIPKVEAQSQVALRSKTSEGPGAKVSNRDEVEGMAGNSNRLRLNSGAPADSLQPSSEGRRGSLGSVNLMPSAAVLDQIVGAAANDHLDEAEGNGTVLNTREWKYASFFNRVKQSVGQHWDPNTQLRLRDPSTQIYGGKDRYTVLTITLDSTGQLKEAFVSKPSGLDFLDVEAVKAFERAQPFPNPPPGLLATDQTVRFQFGFMLEMSGRPGIKLFRY